MFPSKVSVIRKVTRERNKNGKEKTHFFSSLWSGECKEKAVKKQKIPKINQCEFWEREEEGRREYMRNFNHETKEDPCKFPFDILIFCNSLQVYSRFLSFFFLFFLYIYIIKQQFFVFFYTDFFFHFFVVFLLFFLGIFFSFFFLSCFVSGLQDIKQAISVQLKKKKKNK